MKKKMGRPKVLKSEAKRILVGAMLSEAEAKQVARRVAQSRQSKSKWVRARLVGIVLPDKAYEAFPVTCANAQELYGGTPPKTAVFQVEHRGSMHVLSGTFIVHLKDLKSYIVIRSYGSNDVPASDYFLSQAHVDSISPLPQLAPKAAYIIQEPFLSRHHVGTTGSHPDSA